MVLDEKKGLMLTTQ